MEADLTRDVCAGCGSSDLRTVLDLGSSPLADRFPASPDEPEEWHRLRMVVCGGCWLAQLADVVDDDDLYGTDYGFLTGGSPASVGYFQQMAREILNSHREQAQHLTVEIACNDGTLLESFPGCRTLGVEPAAPAAEAARQRGLTVLCEPFTEKTGHRIRDVYGPAGVVVACNVVAHVANPLGFLAGVRALLADDGVAVLEFQDLADLVMGCQFDHVYHEHRFFFSLDSFTVLASRAGLEVTGWVHTPAQGGSLRVTVRRGLHLPPGPPEFPWLATSGAYAPLQGRAEAIRGRLRDLVAAVPVVAGYAASAKSATLLNFSGLGPGDIGWVVDATPAKAGRFTPGTRIPIVGDGDRPDPGAYLLLAWNYLGAVLRRETAYLQRGGKFIVPIPVPVII